MGAKIKLTLSRNLSAQTSPYPQAERWIKLSVGAIILVLILGVFTSAKPKKPPFEVTRTSSIKKILGSQNPSIEYLDYEVKKGDTLFNLSQRYKVSWQTLAELNQLSEPFILKLGHKIKIPVF